MFNAVFGFATFGEGGHVVSFEYKALPVVLLRSLLIVVRGGVRTMPSSEVRRAIVQEADAAVASDAGPVQIYLDI